MSLSQVCLSQTMESDGEIDGASGDYCPFLALPDELIGNIFSFLSIEDRLRARVNRRLNKIELKCKYYVDKLYIRDGSEENRASKKESCQGHMIYFIKGRSYSSICIKRLTHNLSVRYLSVELWGVSDFHREVYSLIKDFNIGKLNLQISCREFEQEIMVDSFFIDLSRACKDLNLCHFGNISPNALRQVHKMMVEGSTDLRALSSSHANNQVPAFLNIIGVACRNGQFFTNRGIEGFVYYFDYHKVYRARFFDGNLEIGLEYRLFGNHPPILEPGRFSLKLHDRNESVDQAKEDLRNNGYACINAAPKKH